MYQKLKPFNIIKIPRQAEKGSKISTIGMRMKLKKERYKSLLERKRNLLISSLAVEDLSTDKNKNLDYSHNSHNPYKEVVKNTNNIYQVNHTYLSNSANEGSDSNIQLPESFTIIPPSKSKEEALIIKNRLAAQLSRDRKKKELEDLKSFTENL